MVGMEVCKAFLDRKDSGNSKVSQKAKIVISPLNQNETALLIIIICNWIEI